MSFIAITFGYNQYSIFNTNTATQPLIDTITTTCLTEINTSIENKKNHWTKEVSLLDSSGSALKKDLVTLQKEKQTEEERIMEMSKQIESPKKGAKGHVGKNFLILADKKKQPFTSELLTKKVEEIKQVNLKLSEISSTKEKLVSKIQNLDQLYQKFSKIGKFVIYLEKKDFKIDLLESNGNKVNIASKGDKYANIYLADRHVYELGKVAISK
jgi:hypothetical protein